MRQDFVSVYNEPGRCRRGIEDCVRRGREPRDPDDLPGFVGMADARRRGWDRKPRDRSYSALSRWLRSMVGRAWDDVWSEICRQADSRSARARWLRRDAARQVDLHTRRDEDGTLRVHPRGREVTGLYVDPEGVLRFVDRPRVRTRFVDPDHVPIDAARCYRRIDGIWYGVELRPLPHKETLTRTGSDGVPFSYVHTPLVFDVVAKKSVSRACCRSWREPDTYAAAKRALSRKELRAAGLENDPDAAGVNRRRRRGERH